MRIYTTWINGQTNNYSVNNGLITQKNNLLTEAYSRIVTPLGSYPFDLTFGSQIPIWINQRLLINSSTITSELERCTAIIVNENRAQYITCQVIDISTTYVYYLVTITDNEGIDIQLNSNYIATGN